MQRHISAVAALLAALAAAGCAGSFEADVARFHDLPAAAGERVTVVPAEPDKAGSPEFETYARLVRAQLEAQGYRPVSENPDIRAELGWHLSAPREKVETRYRGGHAGFGRHGVHRYSFGRHGFGGQGHGGHGGHVLHGFPGFHGAGHGPHGGRRDVVSTTLRDLRLELTMRKSGGDTLFEGRADTTIPNTDVTTVMPFLVQALFTDFPGESGTIRTVELERERKPQRSD